MTRKLAAILAILAILSLGWGEATHIHIAQEAMRGQYLTTVQRQALTFGATAPDSRLLVDRNTGVHLMLHAQVFLDKLKSLAVTTEEKAFVAGYQSHLISDPIERAYTSSKLYLGASPEMIIDAMIMKDKPALKQVRIVASPATKSLFVKAWKAAYPTYSWQMTTAFLDQAVSAFNSYLWAMAYTNVSSIAWTTYSDYYQAVQQSIEASKAAIGQIAPSPTPTPTPWWWRLR